MPRPGRDGGSGDVLPHHKIPEDFSSPGPVTILFDGQGRRLSNPEIRQMPQITGIDGVDTTFFGGSDSTGAASQLLRDERGGAECRAVAALVIQAAGDDRMSPDEIYDRLMDTATRVPLAENRTLGVRFAGPVIASANGALPSAENYWRLFVEPFTNKTVSSVTINLTSPDMFL
jgi:hypothetical protein